jgi:hypothetical protein
MTSIGVGKPHWRLTEVVEKLPKISDRAVLRGIGLEAVEYGSCREADGRGKEEATLHVVKHSHYRHR